jgi:hypothetical protein
LLAENRLTCANDEPKPGYEVVKDGGSVGLPL